MVRFLLQLVLHLGIYRNALLSDSLARKAGIVDALPLFLASVGHSTSMIVSIRAMGFESRAGWWWSQCAIVYTEYANMDTEKIGMREFRENLAGYLEAGKPLAITRHGETLGFYIPAHKRSRKAEVEAMRAAAKELDSMIAEWGASEDELMKEYQEIRRASREQKRNAK